jgi:hypothetical protein
MLYKIVLLKKYDENCFFWSTLLETKKYLNLSVKEIINNYNGFEGDNILYWEFDSLDDISNIKTQIKEMLYNEEITGFLCLLLKKAKEKKYSINIDSLIFLGYEYGFYKDELNFYSSIFHEIIFGDFSELITFERKLNEYYLFASYEQSKEYVKKHNQLFAEGYSVEDDTDMEIYEIWKINL